MSFLHKSRAVTQTIFTVTQVGDHIVGRNMVFACFLSCIDTRNETGIQKVLGVLLVDAGNTVERVFRHSVGIYQIIVCRIFSYFQLQENLLFFHNLSLQQK